MRTSAEPNSKGEFASRSNPLETRCPHTAVSWLKEPVENPLREESQAKTPSI